MGYLNENGLARYDGLIKNWTTFKSGTVDGIDPLLNWQKTETAASVAFYPLPAAPLDPVVNFLFAETGPAVGTKGPDNPSTITGVSSITVTRCETVGVDSTDYTVNLNGTYYGGSVDLSAGTMTVTHEVIVLDGSESWTLDSSSTETIFTFLGSNILSYAPNPADNGACTHIPLYSGPIVLNSFRIYTNKNIAFRLDATSFPTVDVLKSWLQTQNSAGTPVKITYTRATPVTVSLTPLQVYSLSQVDSYTPRINTVYSDQASVQVGYPKSPIATASELTNAIVSLGGNI